MCFYGVWTFDCGHYKWAVCLYHCPNEPEITGRPCFKKTAVSVKPFPGHCEICHLANLRDQLEDLNKAMQTIEQNFAGDSKKASTLNSELNKPDQIEELRKSLTDLMVHLQQMGRRIEEVLVSRPILVDDNRKEDMRWRMRITPYHW
jgi:septal ring factor EnvC (AmiA/AmiB activator)